MNTILESVLASRDPQCRPQGRPFLVHGSGGVGKTISEYFGVILAEGRSIIVLCVASSGIAALLIIGGRTTHMRFQTVHWHPCPSVCNIRKNDPLADDQTDRSDYLGWSHHANRLLLRLLTGLCGFLGQWCSIWWHYCCLGWWLQTDSPVIVRRLQGGTVGASIQTLTSGPMSRCCIWLKTCGWIPMILRVFNLLSGYRMWGK